MPKKLFSQFVALIAISATLNYVKDCAVARHNIKRGMDAQKTAIQDWFPESEEDFDDSMKNVPDLTDHTI